MELSEKQKENLTIVFEKYLNSHLLQHSFVEETIDSEFTESESYQLKDALTPDGCGVNIGQLEIENLAECLTLEMIDFLLQEEIMNSKQNEYRKFQCVECFMKYKSKSLNFYYCTACGAEVEIMLADLSMPQQPETDLKRQWLEALGTGWPCEVRRKDKRRLVYFRRHDKNGFYFVMHSDDEWGEYYKKFRPLGTPLDFAYKEAVSIEIRNDNKFIFLDKNNRPIQLDVWTPWPNCPEGMKGKTLKIPEDWRR